MLYLYVHGNLFGSSDSFGAIHYILTKLDMLQRQPASIEKHFVSVKCGKYQIISSPPRDRPIDLGLASVNLGI